MTERAVSFACGREQLIGVVSLPRSPKTVGVVIVVGGPQYRVGSHRQFVLLARALADAGYPTLRFDCRGMGDSTGEPQPFESLDDDIRAAIDTLTGTCPTVQKVALWGLCDAASAAMLYGPTDDRVVGLALANPWARGSDTYAQTRLKHYYLRRLASKDFWIKLGRLNFGWRKAIHDLRDNFVHATAARPGADYRRRMLDSVSRYRGAVHLLISGADLTAREFLLYLDSHPAAGQRLGEATVERTTLVQADHTFSRAEWRADVEEATRSWLDRLEAAAEASMGPACKHNI